MNDQQRNLVFLAAIAAVGLALFVLKVRIAVAGFKYMLVIALILGVVWWLGRLGKR